MTDEKFLRNVDESLKNTIDRQLQEPPRFGGEPGEAVPAVDPENLKTIWRIERDAKAINGCGVAVGISLMKQACKPGDNLEAVCYRSSLIWFMSKIAPEELGRFMQDGQPDDAVFRAAAKVRAEWMGVGIVRKGPPFDVNEFLKLCGDK